LALGWVALTLRWILLLLGRIALTLRWILLLLGRRSSGWRGLAVERI
jgi:hypothetical protein